MICPQAHGNACEGVDNTGCHATGDGFNGMVIAEPPNNRWIPRPFRGKRGRIVSSGLLGQSWNCSLPRLSHLLDGELFRVLPTDPIPRSHGTGSLILLFVIIPSPPIGRVFKAEPAGTSSMFVGT